MKSVSIRRVRKGLIRQLPTIVIAMCVTATIAVAAITSAQIKNGTIQSIDIRNGTIKAVDVGANALGSASVAGLSGADITDGSLTGADIQDSSILAAEVGANALTGEEIDETTLNNVNAAELDGKDSNEFVQANGSLSFAFGMANSNSDYTLGTIGSFTFKASCSLPGLDNRAVLKVSTSADNANVNSDQTDDSDFDVADGDLNILVNETGSDSFDAGLISADSDDGATSIFTTGQVAAWTYHAAGGTTYDCWFTGHLQNNAPSIT